MTKVWAPKAAGVLRLPSGRLIRGRGLRRPMPQDGAPDFGLYLLRRPPAPMGWEQRWVRWPDFWLPTDKRDARDAFVDAWQRSGNERVEIACGGGRGRTGTALACIAVLEGASADEAVSLVRERWDVRAVETPWQRRYVAHFDGAHQ
ncbi:MAG: protein phosphatase [Nocardioidaceae bacterium]|nr:protein phosphatase [Nocardioidaceae bacterium]